MILMPFFVFGLVQAAAIGLAIFVARRIPTPGKAYAFGTLIGVLAAFVLFLLVLLVGPLSLLNEPIVLPT